MALRYSSRIAWQRISDEAVIVDLDSGSATGLNVTGSAVWSMLENHDLEEIAAALSADHGLCIATARDDVQAFVESLLERGLVVEDH